MAHLRWGLLVLIAVSVVACTTLVEELPENGSVNGGPARVLEALRRADGRSCSGETLSAEYGISRAQIWKHVQALRARGYSIEGEAGAGYRLAAVPDRLYPEEIQARLRTRWLARRIEWLDETDSTNRVAADLARAGAEHGTAVVAEPA